MAKAVFETVVFVRALLNSRSVCGRLVYALRQRYRLFLSPPVFEEILEVLAREELIRRLRLRDANYAEAIDGLLHSLRRAETIDLSEIRAVSRDPKDDKFLATARAIGADYLISEDDDLLVLGEYEGTKIPTCGQFVDLLGRQGA